MVLKRDEEEVLKVLLKLHNQQSKTTVTGSFSDFPIKYQIVYKEILLRLQDQKFIKDFEDFIAEDFLVTLLPPALSYFNRKEQPEKAKTQISVYNQTIRELEALIVLQTGTDKTQMIEITKEIEEFCENLKKSPTVQPRRILFKKISELSKKYPWLSEKITKALGLTMMDIIAGN